MSDFPRRTGEFTWEIPVGHRPGMRVPGIIYADEQLMAAIRRDASLEQVANAACLPGIVKASLAMPDMHYGYGLPIGGVVATSASDGVISPGGVGFDINCGVRLAGTRLFREDLDDPALRRHVVETLFREVPTGVGSRGNIRLSGPDGKRVLRDGALWAVKQGYGSPRDLEHTEAGGRLDGADPDVISPKAFQRGRDQQGTLGSGNHFIEIQCVAEIFDPEAAGAFGLQQDLVTVMIHSGSRGFGHQVCTDFLGVMERAARTYGIVLPDRQLACAPVDSPEGRDYLAAMRAAANYAWANRQCLMHWTDQALQKALGMSPERLGLFLVYDVAHNIVKMEKHLVGGRETTLAVHRKGATRAFGPGHPEVPADYRRVGQPVIIPGDMGTGSFVLAGTEEGMAKTFGSSCHGAGRVLSRTAAIRAARGRTIERELEERGIFVRARGRETLKEEMPDAYKEIGAVVDVVHRAGLARKVVRLQPLGVIKG